MSRYIDLNTALSFPYANGEYDKKSANTDFIKGCESYKEWLESLPAVDIVRCKDCRYLTYSDMYGECGKALLGVVTPNDYCSHGERKEGEQNG